MRPRRRDCPKDTVHALVKCSLRCPGDPNYKKHEHLTLHQPQNMKDMDISDLPGISNRSASRLRVNGIRCADTLLSRLIECGKDELCFVNWLMRVGHMRRVDAGICFSTLTEWCDTNLR
ncbi:hypothetical protein LSAT2_013786 [Lamellibrachia satsuma]|nr:hypothetical protein LSAT2_013786 [Lamellibrachia satsuma]